MSISDLLPSSSPLRRWRSFGLLEALTVHLVLSCTWLCNGTFEHYNTKEFPVNVDYNIYVIYEDPYNASVREPFTPDLDPQCLNANQMGYMGHSNACYRSDMLCSQLQSSSLMSKEHRSTEAEAMPRSFKIGSIFKRIREELLESQKSGIINMDASSIPLPFLVDVKPHLLDWGNGYLHSRKLACFTLTNKQNSTVFRVFKPDSNNNQFYVCNYSGSLLDAGGKVSNCLVFHPKHLGLSPAQLVIESNCGGFLIQGKGFAVNHSIEDKLVEMEKIHFRGWWSKSNSLFSSISLPVYAMEFRLSITGIMRSLFKKIQRILSMKKIYAVTFFVVTLMFLGHFSTTLLIMQRWTCLFMGGNNSMPTGGSARKSTSVHQNQQVSGHSISHKMDVRHSLKKKNRTMVMDCGDNAEQSVVSQCAKLKPVIFCVDSISREKKKQESAASPVTKSAVVLNGENGDSANIGIIQVKVGKEKRKKKRGKGPRAGAPVSIDSPGSQSGNSTPPTPMSPVTTVLLPNQSSFYAKSEKHRKPRSPIKTMISHFSEKPAFMQKSVTANDMKASVPKNVLANAPKQTLNEPVLGSSHKFPAVEYPAHHPYPPYYLPPSAIAPHARAPGSKVCKTGEEVALVKEEAVSDFTYDIWGDSLFAFDRIGRPKEPSVISLGNDSGSFSFFAEGPVLVENFHPRYVSPIGPKGMIVAANVLWHSYSHRLERVAWYLLCDISSMQLLLFIILLDDHLQAMDVKSLRVLVETFLSSLASGRGRLTVNWRYHVRCLMVSVCLIVAKSYCNIFIWRNTDAFSHLSLQNSLFITMTFSKGSVKFSGKGITSAVRQNCAVIDQQ